MASSDGISTFVWSGLDPAGQPVKKKTIVSTSQGAAVHSLREQGYLVTDIAEKSTASWNVTIGYDGVKFKVGQRAQFVRRMHQLLRAGVGVPEALLSLGEEANPKVTEMCKQMADRVSSGRSLAQAMAEHPRAFDPVSIAYVEGGETMGDLRESLASLSVLLAKRAAMHAKIKGVTAYPKMVGGTMVVIVFGIITFLVPSLSKVYDQFGAELPGPTQAVVWASGHVSPIEFKTITEPFPFWLPIPQFFSFTAILSYFIIGWLVFRARTRDNLEVGMKLDKIKFRMPVLGTLWAKSSLFQWASTLAGSMSAGMSLAPGLELAASASGSDWQKLAAKDLGQSVQAGRPLSQAMAEHSDLYPPDVRTMVATGDRTGDVDVMLQSVAQSLDEEVASVVEGLSAKIEVSLLIVLGVVVGGLVIVLYLPILGMASAASQGLGI